jgi:hypothetical protein
MNVGRGSVAPASSPAAFCRSRALASRETILVFDLGGSWWRVGVLTGAADLRPLGRVAAVNRVRTGKSASAVLHELAEFVVESTRGLAALHPFRAVGVSIGAAVDGHTGSVIASAPLWGPEVTDFDLAARLREGLPDISWVILNDVSALAFAVLADHPAGPGGKAAAVTVSSGIAYRTVDMRSGHIPLDPAHGLQKRGIAGVALLTPALRSRRASDVRRSGTGGGRGRYSVRLIITSKKTRARRRKRASVTAFRRGQRGSDNDILSRYVTEPGCAGPAVSNVAVQLLGRCGGDAPRSAPAAAGSRYDTDSAGGRRGRHGATAMVGCRDPRGHRRTGWVAVESAVMSAAGVRAAARPASPRL